MFRSFKPGLRTKPFCSQYDWLGGWQEINGFERFAERAQEFLGVGRATSDHAGRQVFLDAVGRGRGALVFLCSPLAHLPVVGEQSAGIENSCLCVV